MVYNYATVEEVRLEAGDPDPEDVSNTDIQNNIDAAGIIIDRETRSTWDSTDLEWPLVQLITRLLASSFVMDKFDDLKKEVEKNFNKGMMLLEKLTHIDVESGDINISVTEYQTFPKNPDGTISRGRLSTNPITETSVDPDAIYEQGF